MTRGLHCSIAAALAAAAGTVLAARAPAPTPSAATVSRVVAGLDNPRGLEFGPDGYLYVAEGGTGGSDMTSMHDCEQAHGIVGPYSGGYTSRISRIDGSGTRTTVVDALPSSQTSPALGSLVSGVADVAFVNGVLYGIEAGAGCSHGLIGTENTVFRVNGDGTTTTVADLSAFQRTHAVAVIEDDDFEPDGTWYSMVAVRGQLYAVEPNHGEVVRIDPVSGAITRVVDVSATYGHIVPTALAYHGNFYFGNLGEFPIVPGSSGLFKLSPGGQLSTWASNLSTVLGLAFGTRDRMYVLESMTDPGFPGPNELGTGRIVQVDPDRQQTVIATGFSFPTAMTMGPDGALYVSNLGFAGAGAGEIDRVTLP